MGRPLTSRPLRFRKADTECPSGKVRYLTKTDALLALASCNAPRRRAGRTKLEVRVYFHHSCKAWHLTSTPARERGTS